MTTVHGGFDTAELRAADLTRDEVLDFSSNINPLGPSRCMTAGRSAGV